MAVVQNTLIGRASGQVGQTIFQKWKSLNVLRSMPVSVANPNTIAQQTQRNKIILLGTLYREAKSVIDIGTKNYSRRSSPAAIFQKWNLKNGLTSIGAPEWVPNVDTFRFSQGNMGISPITGVSVIGSPGNQGVRVTWSSSYLPVNAQSNDRISLIVIRQLTQQVVIVSTTTRSFGNATALFNDTIGSGELFFISLAFRSFTTPSLSAYTPLVSDNDNGIYIN